MACLSWNDSLTHGTQAACPNILQWHSQFHIFLSWALRGLLGLHKSFTTYTCRVHFGFFTHWVWNQWSRKSSINSPFLRLLSEEKEPWQLKIHHSFLLALGKGSYIHYIIFFYSMLDILVGVVLFLVSSVESRVEKELHKHGAVLCDFVEKLTSTSASWRKILALLLYCCLLVIES